MRAGSKAGFYLYFVFLYYHLAMTIIVKIALRNLVRQKRRSILLGIAIAFGTMVLILACAFSHGISTVLLERIVKVSCGHVSITFMKNGNVLNKIFHDGDMIRDAIRKEAPEALRYDEVITMVGRAISNTTADNVILVGVDGKMPPDELKEFESNFKIVDGSFSALKDSSSGTPVLISNQKANTLKIKRGDVLKVRLTDINNQWSSARLVVVGIFKPSNPYMSMPIIFNNRDLRLLAGYGPHDIPSIQIEIKDPQKNARKVAERIYHSLKPSIAVIEGNAQCRNICAEAIVLGFKNDMASRSVFSRMLPLAQGDSAAAFGLNGVILSPSLATKYGAGVGDTLNVAWHGKYDTAFTVAKFTVTAVAAATAMVPQNCLFVNEHDFYHWYYMTLPAAPSAAAKAAFPGISSPFYKALAPEYTLMKQCATTQELQNEFRELSRQRVRGVVVSVQSMYETGSIILSMEAALNLISGIAGLVLFFIILIGIINTLRMTIRERTREIGTIRAIGMQKSDVLFMFIFETVFLSLFSSLIGTILAFLAMWGLSTIPIDAGESPMGMLLENGRLFFAPTAYGTVGFIFIIVGIAVGTTFLPARRASNLPAANAMRHYE